MTHPLTYVREQIRQRGEVAGISMRQARAATGLSSSELARLPFWKTLRLDRSSDRYVVVGSFGAWAERALSPAHTWLLYWTKDLPSRWAAYRGPRSSWCYQGQYKIGQVIRPFVYGHEGDPRPRVWPHTVHAREPYDDQPYRLGSNCWKTRRLTLVERLRRWV